MKSLYGKSPTRLGNGHKSQNRRLFLMVSTGTHLRLKPRVCIPKKLNKTPSNEGRRIRRRLHALRERSGFGERSIGAEYGEGFEVFSADRWSHIDVAALNQSLRTKGAQRLRHAMKPDEALGAIFVLEGVLADTRRLSERSWQLLAEENAQRLPPVLGPHMFDLPPVKIITDVLRWHRDVSKARQLAHRLAQIYGELFVGLEQPQIGALAWLKALEKTKVPCAVMSHMNRDAVHRVLDQMGIRHYFSVDVTFEDDMETLAQQYLCAAVKLQRPPDHCIVFEYSPMGIAAAHNCTMKAVAVQGYFKGYQLKQADVTCASLDELTVYNLRRLFANRGCEFMDHLKANSTTPKKRENTIATF